MIWDIVESPEGERVQRVSRWFGDSPEVWGFMGEGAHPTGPMETLQGTAEVVQASVGRGAGICLLPACHPLPLSKPLVCLCFQQIWKHFGQCVPRPPPLSLKDSNSASTSGPTGH